MKHLLRIAIGIVGAILVLDAAVLIFRGVVLTSHAYRDILTAADVDRPLLPALEAVDLFFMAIAFLIAAIGLMQLYLGDLRFLQLPQLASMRVENLGQLKLLLWDTFLLTIFVLFVTHLIGAHEFGWKTLVLPGAILMLALSSFLLKSKH